MVMDETGEQGEEDGYLCNELNCPPLQAAGTSGREETPERGKRLDVHVRTNLLLEVKLFRRVYTILLESG
jgi:hypothetical protein